MKDIDWAGLKLAVEVTIPATDYSCNSLQSMDALARKLEDVGIPAGVLVAGNTLAGVSLSLYGGQFVDGVAVVRGTLTKQFNMKDNTYTFIWTP